MYLQPSFGRKSYFYMQQSSIFIKMKPKDFWNQVFKGSFNRVKMFNKDRSKKITRLPSLKSKIDFKKYTFLDKNGIGIML